MKTKPLYPALIFITLIVSPLWTTAKSSDFNFLIGEWSIINKKLKERLKGSNE